MEMINMSDGDQINDAQTFEYNELPEKSRHAFLGVTEEEAHPTILFDSFFEIK